MDRPIEYGVVRAVDCLFVVVVLHPIIIDGMCVGLCETRGGIRIIAIDGRKFAVEHDEELWGIGYSFRLYVTTTVVYPRSDRSEPYLIGI